MHFSNAISEDFVSSPLQLLLLLIYSMYALGHVLSIFPLKEEEDAAKAEMEETIIDPNGDVVCVKAAKHMIEYCITFHYPTIFHLLDRTFFFFHPGTASVRNKGER